MSQLERGLQAERELAELLGRQVPGLSILQVEARSNARRGPRVRSVDFGELPAHDIRAIFERKHFDIQLKLKGRASWRRASKDVSYYEHGFDLPVYNGYLRLIEVSDTPCYLIVWEEAPPGEGIMPNMAPEMLGQWLHRIRTQARIDEQPRDHARRGMAYWPRRLFVPIYDNARQRFFDGPTGNLVVRYELGNELLGKAPRQRPTIATTCRWCGGRAEPGIILGDGTAECIICADAEVWRHHA